MGSISICNTSNVSESSQASGRSSGTSAMIGTRGDHDLVLPVRQPQRWSRARLPRPRAVPHQDRRRPRPAGPGQGQRRCRSRTHPTNRTPVRPERCAASAWLAPLPPGSVSSDWPRTVSPGRGKDGTRKIKSRLIEPKTTTAIAYPPRGPPPDAPPRRGHRSNVSDSLTCCSCCPRRISIVLLANENGRQKPTRDGCETVPNPR